MRFNSLITLIEFIKFMEGTGYVSSISSRDIREHFKNLKHISQYSVLFEVFGNVVLLTFYCHDHVHTIIELNKKEG